MARLGPAALRVFGIGAQRKGTIESEQLSARLIAGSNQEAQPVAAMAVAQRAVEIAIAARHVLVAAGGAETLLIGAGDEIDHAGDRIRAVSRGGAVLEHLHPADRGERNQVDVDGRRTRAGRHQPLAVEQHQGPLRRQPAQIDRRDPLGALRARVELIGVAQHAGRRRQRLHQLDDGGAALPLQFLRADHVDRRARILARAADQRPGHDDIGWHACRSFAAGDLCRCRRDMQHGNR